MQHLGPITNQGSTCFELNRPQPLGICAETTKITLSQHLTKYNRQTHWMVNVRAAIGEIGGL